MANTHIPIENMVHNRTLKKEGDFGIRIKKGVVRVPQIIHRILLENNWVGGPRDLIRMADTYPSEFVQRLGWSLDHVKKANRALVSLLKKKFPGNEWPDLDAARPKRVFGVKRSR